MEQSDYAALVPLLADYYQGIRAIDDEEAAIRNIAENVVSTGEPLAEIYDTRGGDPDVRINYAPRISSTDLELFFSLLREVETAFEMEIPHEHIHLATRRTILLKSLVAASLNFYRACEDVKEADEFTEEIRENFYYSLLVLLVEVVLVKYPFDYWIAWRGTRFIHNQFLVRIRSILGNRGIAVVMKLIHWSLIRRQVDFEFATDFYTASVEFVLAGGNGQEIYDRAEDALEGVDEEFELGRMEAYNIDMEVEIDQRPEEFIIESLLIPLAEEVDDSIEDGRKLLLETLEERHGLPLQEMIETGYDDVWLDAIELLSDEDEES